MCKSVECRQAFSSNEYFVAKIGVDTVEKAELVLPSLENEPLKMCFIFKRRGLHFHISIQPAVVILPLSSDTADCECQGVTSHQTVPSPALHVQPRQYVDAYSKVFSPSRRSGACCVFVCVPVSNTFFSDTFRFSIFNNDIFFLLFGSLTFQARVGESVLQGRLFGSFNVACQHCLSGLS
jgi:hypothetical protein